jgi:hypothetical protein
VRRDRIRLGVEVEQPPAAGDGRSLVAHVIEPEAAVDVARRDEQLGDARAAR